MRRDVNPFASLVAGQAIPSVKPNDLRKVWKVVQGLPESKATGMALFKRKCRLGRDAHFVCYRAMMLNALYQSPSSFTGWARADDPDKAVFSVAATFPMTWVEPGAIQNHFFSM